ncbi:MAG: hypothetical protein HY366_01665, partial [Candidatus Aenigmarchaeota archaeon]|nr:hypothetical protein [Candidatus Aenigmarchaeota archaeon]
SGSTQSQLATQEFRNCCSKYVTATGCQADPTVWPYDPDATSGANAPPLAPNSGVCGFNDLNNDGRRNPIDATDKSTPEKVWSLQTLGGRIGTTDSTSIRRACGCPGAG